ncbi:MAG: hypothetical protein WA667_20775 [Candidatus Nitrosopolaris sp.]
MSVDALLLQLTNIENGYMWTFVIGIPCAVWGYLAYLKHKKKGITSSRTKGLSGEATTKQLSSLGSVMGD